MGIQWFPGHMNKARKEIGQLMKEVDVVIEVRDARAPFSTTNPLIESLRGDKPCIRLLNKQDLADPKVTAAWLDALTGEHEQAQAISALTIKEINDLPARCRVLFPNKVSRRRSIGAAVLGIPNVGKSTLINALKGRRVAKVGNEPAITKQRQRIELTPLFYLIDTPGILWPRIDIESCAYTLAAIGSIKDTVIDYYDLALYTGEHLLTHYPEQVMARFKLKTLPVSSDSLIEKIGEKRGCLRKGKDMDLHRASEILIHELREGKIGRISMETPEGIEKLLAAEKKKEQEES